MTMLNQDTVREATRLTQAGQLAEATALLQRMLRGERAPEATTRTPGRISLTGREPPTIDAKANDVEKADRAHPLAPRAPSFVPRRPQPLFEPRQGWLLAWNARPEAYSAVRVGHRAGGRAVH